MAFVSYFLNTWCWPGSQEEGRWEILRKEGVAVDGAAPWLRVIHSRPNAESGRHWSAFSTPSHTSHSCGRGRVVHSAASLPSWRLLSPPAFQNLCFLDKGSFYVWHSIQNPWDPQQEEQAAALGTWRHPGLVLVLGHPVSESQMHHLKLKITTSPKPFCRKTVRFAKWDEGLVFRAECLSPFTF